MTANPLVAGPVNTSTAFGGTGVLESVTDLCTSLKSGDWLASEMAGVGAALDIAATVIDPLGSLIGAGLGWLMEHLEPLKGWLNDLAGDAGAVLGFASTWANAAIAMGAAGDELNRVVRSDLEAMSGASITAYAAYIDKLADHIRVTGTSASAIGEALKTCATVVKVVHDLVATRWRNSSGRSSPGSPRPSSPSGSQPQSSSDRSPLGCRLWPRRSGSPSPTS